ncbi:probable ATP-dependent RNA helicase ddx20 [Onthophagus taurus]|uniref:probable ATP-dependent RNA helicase ddx20 n=1 Tax=Onthophagus taurus TaxID=166361 RepID=UPI000C20E227|nr:guanine nucleotide-binding protein-like 3 homolog [Onthophagus taurus]
MVSVDGKEVRRFIDLGSEVVTMRKRNAHNLNLGYIPYAIQLKGFGGMKSCTIGKRQITLKIDDIVVDVEMIIGNSAFKDPNILLIKQGDTLRIQCTLQTIANENNVQENEINKENENVKVDKGDEDDKEKNEDDYRRSEGEEDEEESKMEDEEENNVEDEDNMNGNLTREELNEVLLQNDDIFARNFNEIGQTKSTEMVIELIDNEPITCRPYRTPYAKS